MYFIKLRVPNCDCFVTNEELLEMVNNEFQDMPETWKQYATDLAGRQAILDMEMREFKQALAANDKKLMLQELGHVVGACFYYAKGITND